MKNPKPLTIEHHVDRDIVLIDGQRFTGAFFRFFGGAQPGRLFEIVSVDEWGTITIKDLGMRKPE